MEAFQEGLLKVEPGVFLWTLLSFGILLLILWKAAWRPIVSSLDERAGRIRRDMETAEASRKEAETLFLKHKETIENARDEAMKIISEGRADAERIKNDILEKANSEAQSIVQRAHRGFYGMAVCIRRGVGVGVEGGDDAVGQFAQAVAARGVPHAFVVGRLNAVLHARQPPGK